MSLWFMGVSLHTYVYVPPLHNNYPVTLRDSDKTVITFRYLFFSTRIRSSYNLQTVIQSKQFLPTYDASQFKGLT